MDFYNEQDQARRSSRLLVGLFLLSVIALIVLTNLLVAGVFWMIGDRTVDQFTYQATQSFWQQFSWQRFGLISLAVGGIVGCAILYKGWQLSGGGKRVAEQLGGSRIYPNTEDPAEKQLLNVVEEMALASGMPVPAVYLLKNEQGINAFAAGTTPADAVIGVTRGCLEQFNREQLQGVIAHEFSHILNGDMRLNIRLIALLFGIVFIGLVGEILLRSGSSRHRYGSRRDNQGGLFFIGLALLAIGWSGNFFGKWIKAAVSRQREFLADASAVQFTRNPNGIGEALKIIGGYAPLAQIDNSHAGEMSHLFFGSALASLRGMFATHPPLPTRIKRIEPGWDGQFIQRQPRPVADTNTVEKDNKKRDILTGIITAAGAGALTGTDDEEDRWDRPLREPFQAIAVLYALLLSDDQTIRQKQCTYIDSAKMPGLKAETLKQSAALSSLDKAHRLPLIERALPALKCLSAEQYKGFHRVLLLLVRADQRYQLFEWCLCQLVQHYLGPDYGRVRLSRPKYKQASAVANEFRVVLSALVHYGGSEPEQQSKAFHRGANAAGLYNITLIPANECDVEGFMAATNKLADCYPLLKPRLLKALTLTAAQDGVYSPVEREMIAAIAAIMDSPIPSFADLPAD